MTTTTRRRSSLSTGNRAARRAHPAQLDPRWRQRPSTYRYVATDDGAVTPVPAGPLFNDPSVRRKWLHRVSRSWVSPQAKAYASHLATRSNEHGRFCFGAQRRLAEEFGRSTDRLQAYTKQLEEAGLLVVERCTPFRGDDGTWKRRWANRYHFIVSARDFRYHLVATTKAPETAPDAPAPIEPPPPSARPSEVPGAPHGPPDGSVEADPAPDERLPSADLAEQVAELRKLIPPSAPARRR
jgi:hypothetical protein